MIDEKALCEYLREYHCKQCKEENNDYGGVVCRTCKVGWMLDLIESCSTIDAVEVVRCKDCKYYQESELLAPNKFCFRLKHPNEDRKIGYNYAPDDFCSYGVKREKTMTKIYRGWWISTIDKKENTYKAVKGQESIIGTKEQIIREIDRKALEELREG